MNSGSGLRNRRTADSDELIDEDEQRAIVASYRKSNTRANTIWKVLTDANDNSQIFSFVLIIAIF